MYLFFLTRRRAYLRRKAKSRATTGLVTWTKLASPGDWIWRMVAGWSRAGELVTGPRREKRLSLSLSLPLSISLLPLFLRASGLQLPHATTRLPKPTKTHENPSTSDTIHAIHPTIGVSSAYPPTAAPKPRITVSLTLDMGRLQSRRPGSRYVVRYSVQFRCTIKH